MILLYKTIQDVLIYKAPVLKNLYDQLVLQSAKDSSIDLSRRRKWKYIEDDSTIF